MVAFQSLLGDLLSMVYTCRLSLSESSSSITCMHFVATLFGSRARAADVGKLTPFDWMGKVVEKYGWFRTATEGYLALGILLVCLSLRTSIFVLYPNELLKM